MKLFQKIMGILLLFTMVGSVLLGASPAAASPQCALPPPGLIGWWPGDGNADDMRGLHDGIALGEIGYAPGYVTTGNGEGFQFTGTVMYVEIDHATVPELVQWTVSTWFRVDDFGPSPIQVLFNARTETAGSVLIYVSGFETLVANGVVESTTVLSLGTFYHLALTFDGATARLYLNGVMQSQALAPLQLNPQGGPQQWYIGSGPLVDGNYNGVVDEFQIFNRALSGAEIQGIYNTGTEGVCKDTDGDRLYDFFEAGFGSDPVNNIDVTNPENQNAANGSGSAETGSRIVSGSFAVEFPPGTQVASGSTTIELIFDPNSPPSVVVRGADLGGGTKVIEMPVDGQDAVCIDDSPMATVETLLTSGSCLSPNVFIAIPFTVGVSDDQDINTSLPSPYTVTRLSGTHIRVEGLQHTAVGTVTDSDLDSVRDQDDACPYTSGTPGFLGCAGTVDLDPDTWNRKSRGKVVTAYIDPAGAFEASDVDVATVRLENVLPAVRAQVQAGLLMVKFDRAAALSLIGDKAGHVDLTVTGQLFDGTPFAGSDRIRVIGP